MTELLERDRQIAALEEAMGAAELRTGRLLVIEGPAGVGKTALLDHARAATVGAGFAVHRARAVELERDLPFGVVRELLSEPAAALELEGPAALAAAPLGLAAPQPGEADALPAALHGLHALCAQLAARRPVALVVDDAHWADAASLRFLAYLGRRIGDLPLLLLVATRPREPGTPQHLLDALVHDCGADVVRPAELSLAATATLVRAHLPDASEELGAACHVATGGNPFLIGELAGELAAAGVPPRPDDVARIAPRTVARSVLLRIARLDDQARAVAEAVALFPEGAAFRHVAALAGLDEPVAAQAADSLAEAGVLARGRPLCFLHPLMRAAVYDDLAPGARAQAHARAADLLAAEQAPPEALAAHLLATEAGGRAETVDILRRAAERALGVGASDVAARYLRRALEEPPDAAVRPHVLRELGVAEVVAGDERAIEHLREALAQAAPGRERAAVARDLAQAEAWVEHYQEAVEAIDLAIAEVQDEDPDLALRYHADALWIEWPSAELTGSYERRLARLPSDLAGDTPNEQLVLCYHAAEAAVALQPHERVVELATRAVGDGRLAALGLAAGGPVSYATNALGACDRIEEARTVVALMIENFRARGEIFGLPLAHSQYAWLSIHMGDLQEAERHARAAQEAAATLPERSLGAQAARTLEIYLRLAQGRLDAAAALCPEGELELASSLVVDIALARARVWLARGDVTDARAELERLREWGAARNHVEVAEDICWSDALAVAQHRCGDVEAARATAAALLDQSRRLGAPGPIGRALLATALVAEDHARVALLEDAVGQLERSPRQLLLAEALVELGAATRREGRRTEARGPLRRALELAGRCGAEGLEARAAEEIRLAHGRVRQVERDALTTGEARVAALAADGRSNREIAAELYLSVKTVEMHLSRAFRKLGVRSRRDLPAALDGEQEVAPGAR